MTLISVDGFKEYTRNELLLEDEEITGVLEATDDLLADLCQRRWEVAPVTPSARVYAPRTASSTTLRIHDCAEITSVVADGVTVLAAARQSEPLNGLDWAGNVRPFEQIRLIGSRWPFDDFRATVTVTARWGWPSIPSPIVRAARVLSKDIAMHRDISFGLAVVPDLAAIRVRQASLVSDLIKNWRRPEAMSGIGGPT